MWKRSKLLVSVVKSQRCFQNASQIRSFLSTPVPEISQMDPKISSYKDLYNYSIEQPENFWKAVSGRLDWHQTFSKTIVGNFPGEVKWFVGGKLNVSVNCVDRHAKTNPDRVAIIYEKDEPGHHEFITYRQLQELVVKYAYILRTVGNVKKGDRVAFYLPCSPTAVAMSLACARLGAIHSIVFAGFSADALASRINDAGATVLITADVACRGGKVLDLKKIVDHALEHTPTIKKVFVDARDGNKTRVQLHHPRDHFLQDLMSDATNVTDVIEYVDSNHPLFILYTSGSTGHPKGLVHSSAGYLLYAMFTYKNVFDHRDGDIFGCVADIGWITGHSYIMYGPLANGGTTLVFESTPVYPDPGRYWEMVQRLKLTHFYCAPTAIRLLLRFGSEWVQKYDRSSLRVLGSVGEPINVDAWQWFYDVVGEKRCDIRDTWWQTETGGICLSPRPSGINDPIVPAMPMRPFYGIQLILKNSKKDAEGEQGALCIEKPWPGLAQSIWQDPKRFHEVYFKEYEPHYFTGDGAIINNEGYWRITGRMDDVINVSGHRLGTTEVEDAMGMHDMVSETAVVGYPHSLKGEGIFAFVVLKEEAKNMDRSVLEKELKLLCKEHIAGYAVPDFILCHDGLPKTRSGKTMRRILRKIAAGETSTESFGDITTLADPSVVKSLIKVRESLNKQ